RTTFAAAGKLSFKLWFNDLGATNHTERGLIRPESRHKIAAVMCWWPYVGRCQYRSVFIFSVVGRFADLFGARAAMCLSCTASVVYYGLLAIADSPLMLFIHKLPAVLMHGLPGAQMVVTDLTEPDKRAEALGKLGLCFGIGMVAGSTLGGTLSTRYGETFAACVAAGGSFISFLLVWTFIPKHTKIQAPQDNTDRKSNAKSVFDLGEITRLMKYPGVAKTFMVKIISGLPSGIFQVMFSVIAMNFFQLAPEQNGYLMAYFGIVSMVIQGGVIGRLTSKYSENSLLLLSIGMSSLVGLAQVQRIHFIL
ncbi:unnamed protein product, partial [Oncorhynchus mykiss]